MKLALIAILAVSALAWTSANLDEIKDHPFHGMSDEQWASTYLMDSSLEEAPEDGWVMDAGNVQDTPETFDWRDDASGCVHVIRDQKSCGSCWAFALSEVVSDRYCLATNGEITNIMSPQYLMDCVGSSHGASGCRGAATLTVSNYLADKYFIDTDSCTPYLATDGHKCASTCDSASTESFKTFGFDRKNKDSFSRDNIAAVQQAIIDNGPIYFSMQVQSDFKAYNGGVYRTETFKSVGGHAVKCVGWGIDDESNSTDYAESHYWIVANSWGTRFGEKGYFRIAMDQKIAYNAGGPIPAVSVQQLIE